MTELLFRMCTDEERWNAMRLLKQREDAMVGVIYSYRRMDSSYKRLIADSQEVMSSEERFAQVSADYESYMSNLYKTHPYDININNMNTTQKGEQE